MIPDRRPEARLDETSRALWDRFVEGIGDKPIVYCSLGSFLTDVDFLRKVVDVFRRRHDWQLVMGLGRMASRADLGDVPDNVLVLDWAPQLEVLAHADVAITHGGTSSIHECIVNGVPVLVCPPNRPDLDQTGNAARVVYHGLGLRGAFDSDTSQDIERNIERLLTDRHFTESLTEMLTVFDRYRMDDVGVRTLEAEYEARRSA